MPVIDHPVHPSTIGGQRYGCFNHPPRWLDQYWCNLAKTSVRSVMSRECRYDQSLADPKCADCTHQGSGEAYAQSVREAAR